MNQKQLENELQFKATKSSGHGGQHVNKTSTQVSLSWDTTTTTAFTDLELTRIRQKLAHRITKDGILQLHSSDTRSQLRNKERVIKRFFEIIRTALIVPKKRKKTKPSRIAKLKRLQAKKKQAEKKSNRRKPDY